jgi:enamine deaminase RidA (YjgF/YER057c/UK114 family)
VTSASPARRRLGTANPYEDRYGYSRALRTGDRVLVSGCTSLVDGQVRHPGDAAAQARVALDTAVSSVVALGGCAADVVLTRMYVVDRAHCDAVGLVHGELFAAVRPVATMVVVAGLVDEQMLVEVELEARIGTGTPLSRPATSPGRPATSPGRPA